MGRETILFKSKEKKNRSEISKFLHQLADKIQDGQVTLRQGNEKISLNIPAGLTLEIQVEDEEKRKKGYSTAWK